MKWLALAVLCIAVACSYGQVFDNPYDSNPLLESELVTMTDVYESMGCTCGCKPRIVHPPQDDKNVSTVIQAITGYRANVALIVDYGTCLVTRTGYFWYIKWGDGFTDHGHLDHLLQVQKVHQYAERCRTYRITVVYCSDYSIQNRKNGTVNAEETYPNCDRYSRCIDASYDPFPPLPLA